MSCLRLFAHAVRLAGSRTRRTAGSRRATKTPTIKMTTRSSIRVKPLRGDRDMASPPTGEEFRYAHYLNRTNGPCHGLSMRFLDQPVGARQCLAAWESPALMADPSKTFGAIQKRGMLERVRVIGF